MTILSKNGQKMMILEQNIEQILAQDEAKCECTIHVGESPVEYELTWHTCAKPLSCIPCVVKHIQIVNEIIDQVGYVGCGFCHELFYTRDDFFTARKI